MVLFTSIVLLLFTYVYIYIKYMWNICEINLMMVNLDDIVYANL